MASPIDLHQSTAASTWWCGPRPHLGWDEMAVGLPEGPIYSRHFLETIFSLCFPLNDRRRAPHSFSKIGRLSSTFSCPFLARLRLLVLLLLLMSGNVHPNPGPIFPCSACARNVTWRGKSVQCCTSSKWVHLRCSRLSLSKFITLGRSHSSSCSPAGNTVNSSTVTSTVTPHCNTVTSSSDSSGLYTSRLLQKSFWGTSIAITLSGTQKVLPTLVGRTYLIGSSLLTSSSWSAEVERAVSERRKAFAGRYFHCRSQKWWRSPSLHLSFPTRFVCHRQGKGWGMAGDLLFSLAQIQL